ncbi:sulfate adenylyltransferase subunit CysN [Brevundimonas variabilis]|uniref:Multifunctional fusion protein n=1 Tax=Brevundimonas variabilis TaxID=74312 RepID=A0A7W9FCQ8_9CAUL|nr:sulfate adenylyltransferase subunit CysN [Brevundimonas variabilis]MBB5744430.1 bifunctional enzyme CysN/CysC [Brevundimonas variabilis]
MDQLRFITCGSVDDGKSTLIGRLLHDAGAVPDDQIAAMTRDSASLGNAGGGTDFALLVDGLTSEREQGITIDVAYRYFSTPRRKFIVADTPGHEQYTRNMVTGASTADLAIVLVDARKGVLTQTRRHSYLVSLLGLKTVVLAVTKMDLVEWSQSTFERIVSDYRAFAETIGLTTVIAVPVSGVTGDNIVTLGESAPWYRGDSLLSVLESVDVAHETTGAGFHMPVQSVIRPDLDFRGYAGQIVSGAIHPGDAVRISPSGQTSRIARIATFDGDLDRAVAGQSVTLALSDHVDVARGDVISAADRPLEAADQFEATIVWMADAPLLPGRAYDLKIGARTVSARITDIRHEVNVNTLEKLAARTLASNAIGVCHLSLGQDIAFAPYHQDRTLGGFILIDRESLATVGAGMIRFALRRSQNIHRQALTVDRAERAGVKGQKPAVVWFTGLSGAGKSTIANAVEALLTAEGRHTILIDGDNLRHGLSRDLGFTDADRVENIRRAAETARLMTDAGLIVLVSLISPFRADRQMARERMVDGEFFEGFIDTPLAVVEARDVKGLYAKARSGALTNFTGIDSPYEAPTHPDIHIRGDLTSVEDAARQIVEHLRAAGRLRAD